MIRSFVVVVAHAGEQRLFERHLMLYLRIGPPLTVLTPKDNPIPFRGVVTYPSDDGGKNHVRRWRQLLPILAEMDADRIILFEPDSFALVPEIPEFYVIGPDRVKRFDAPMVIGNVKYGPSSHAAVSSTHYVLHPIILTRAAIRSLLEAWRAIPDDFEGGHSDRALFRLAQQSGIRIVDFHRYGLGYGDIRIFPAEYPAMVNAIQKGANLIHGIKDWEALD